MEPCPRSTTWPYVIVVLGLFLVAVVSPRWWRSLDDAQRRAVTAKLTLQAEPLESERIPTPKVARPRRIYVDFHPDWLRPQVARMNPQVAQRVIIEPIPEEAPHVTPAISQPRVGKPDAADGEKNQPTIADGDGQPALSRETAHPRLPIPEPVDITDFVLKDVSSSLPAVDSPPTKPARVEKPSEWPEPTALLASLDEVCVDLPVVEDWRSAAIELVWQLQATKTLTNPQVKPILAELTKLTAALPLVEKPLEESERVLLRQIAYGIDRRVAVWSAVHEGAKSASDPADVHVADALPILGEVEELLMSSGPNADSWRIYLMLDKLNQIATSSWVTDPSVRLNTARLVIRRMSNRELTEPQRQFLQASPFVELVEQLNLWAKAPIDYPKLTRTIEQFESSRSAGLGERLMESIDDLVWTDEAGAARLHKVLDTHYRNANLRIAISGQLLNDLLPVLEPIQERVSDRILGAAVRGQNQTWTRLRVKLIEDDQRIRLRFVASGNTHSRTVSTKGPVRFFSRGTSNFQAGKELMLSSDGIVAHRATATADGNTRLTELQTDFDYVPLIGWMMRQLAIDELREKRGQMRSAVSQRVSSAARERLDETLEERISNAETKLKEKILDPLRQLNLDPNALEMRSTKERMIMRCRIASESQLAAYTPRPRALGDSVLSMQFHESSANNLLEQLELDGQRIELEELLKRMSERLDLKRADIHEDIPEGVKLRLGEDRPIQVDFDDERVLITIRLAELSTPRKKWRNFVVRGRYRADIARMHIDLFRDGGIELISDQLGLRDQVALRGIFTKVMTRNHRLNIIRGRLADDPRLSKLAVTQFVVRDGWVGISVGPQPTSRVANDINVTAR